MQTRPGRDLSTLTTATLEKSYAALAGDVISYAHGSHGIEIAKGLLAPEQPAVEVFDLLVDLFDRLVCVGPSPFVLRSFETRILGALGLTPVFGKCCGCQAGLGEEEQARLVVRRTGLLCEACARKEMGGLVLGYRARRLLLAAQRCTDFKSIGPEVDALPEVRVAARKASLALIQGHLGRPLRSIEFMRSLVKTHGIPEAGVGSENDKASSSLRAE